MNVLFKLTVKSKDVICYNIVPDDSSSEILGSIIIEPKKRIANVLILPEFEGYSNIIMRRINEFLKKLE